MRSEHGRRVRAASAGVFVAVALLAGPPSCSSASDGGGGGDCSSFCGHLGFGENCGGAQTVDACNRECPTLIAHCPSLAPKMIACIDKLQIQCTSPGEAHARSRSTPQDPKELVSPSGTIYVEDPECREYVDDFNDCHTGVDSGVGVDTGGGGGTDTGTTSDSGTSVDTGGGGGTDTGAGGDTGGGGDTGACSGSYPQHCASHEGAPSGCWASTIDCATIVQCPSGSKACGTGKVVDCAADKCLTPTVAESTDAACSNGADDDGNGFVDCKDFHCTANASVDVCKGERNDVSCSNGTDDDGNGFADCKDLNCQISPAVTVCPAEKGYDACHNGTDDDGDGKVDCADVTCYGSPVSGC